MKKTKIMVILGLFLGVAVGNLFAQYLDVGDDPAKIEIASTKNIIYNGKPIGGYAWSYDGEWFLGANNDGGYIMDKNGAFLQKLPRKFNYDEVTIFFDSKRIFYEFEDSVTRKDYYTIYNLQTKQETLLPIDSQKEQFIDISPLGEILFVQEIVVSRKITYKFVSFNPESGSRQELGVISGVSIYNEFGIFRYFDRNNLLLLVSDNGAKLKKYDFSTNKFLTIITFNCYTPFYLKLHDSRNVIATTFDDLVFLFETSGALLWKFSALFDRGEPDQYGNDPDLIPGDNNSDRALAPNGKLILIRMAKRSDESASSTEEIYMFNLKGNSVRFSMPYPFSSTKWSSQGDRMLNGDLIVYLRKKN
jgi:hypothetical protein